MSNQSGRPVSYQCSQAPPRSKHVTFILAALKGASGDRVVAGGSLTNAAFAEEASAVALPSVKFSAIHSLRVFYRSARLSRLAGALLRLLH